MKEHSKNDICKFTFICTTVALIAFAFVHSMMPADLSGKESSNTLYILQSLLDKLSLKIELNDYIVRKFAHFSEYTAIGMSLMGCAFSFDFKKPYKYIFKILFTGLLTPVIDETIQLNIEGRSGQVTDILLDFFGCLTGIFTVTIIIRAIGLLRKSKKQKT